ncbi:hypothetical protein GCM10011415_02290 [Salipiger pallidus]|uniref:Helix-turn-helix domain-containing protein n=1 Tax=Salipiger pallidus TaxID=1775170 RepID=A0A8J3EEN2_9RHOB|nr:hypothetical protein [Salipiger pallidus]GGG59864.1 hypothetical protein GCM10011415_02290 [Salipiger pallidus]
MSDHLKLVVSNGSCADLAAPRAGRSRSKLLDRYRLRMISAELWAAYLRQHFRNPEDVAAHFEVRCSTAWNWWGAVSRPSADKVMLALLEDDGFAPWLHAAVQCAQRGAA